MKVNGVASLVVEVLPRKNGKGVCAHCGQPAAGYDRASQPRLFAFVPLWGFPVYLRYRMRRVNCTDCGIKVEQVPWSAGKSPRTRALEVFLARWARRLSWSEVAQVFQTSWEQVYRSVCAVVDYGLARRSLDGIGAIGVDEVQCGRGHDYMTVVYQLDGARKRLLHVARRRTAKSFLSFFRLLTAEQDRSIRFVCSDMWKAYLKVIAKKLPHALHILDRFHVVAQLNKAVDHVRREEARRLRTQGYEDVLNNGRYCFLKNPDNLTDRQRIKLDDLLQYDLKSVRAYLLKESFQAFWHYQSPRWAQWFLRKWCARAMRSQLKPIKQFVKTLRRHEPLLMNYFKAEKAFSSGAVEGLNRKINLVTRKSYGFRNFDVMKIALYHTMGRLPEPPLTHRFC